MSRLFGIGDTEFLLIIIFAFLLFGPDKLPGMGRTIGRGLRQFREASDSVTKVVQSEVIDPMTKAATGAGDSVKSKVASNEDADIEEEDLSGRATETFAQRKARLAAEKERRRQQLTTLRPARRPSPAKRPKRLPRQPRPPRPSPV